MSPGGTRGWGRGVSTLSALGAAPEPPAGTAGGVGARAGGVSARGEGGRGTRGGTVGGRESECEEGGMGPVGAMAHEAAGRAQGQAGSRWEEPVMAPVWAQGQAVSARALAVWARGLGGCGRGQEREVAELAEKAGAHRQCLAHLSAHPSANRAASCPSAFHPARPYTRAAAYPLPPPSSSSGSTRPTRDGHLPPGRLMSSGRR